MESHFPPGPTPVCVLDGAMGTMLQNWGVDFGKFGSMWSSSVLLQNPALVQRVHEAYVAAGCDVLLACTYQMNQAGCQSEGTSTEDLVQLAIRTAAAAMPRTRVALPPPDASVIGPVYPSALDLFGPAASRRARVLCGSLGPYGSALPGGQEYRGNYDVSRGLITSFHAPRIQAFWKLHDLAAAAEQAEGAESVDVLLLETFPQLAEVQEIVAWMRETLAARGNALAVMTRMGLPVCFSFVAEPLPRLFQGPEVGGGGSEEALDRWWRDQEQEICLPDGRTFEDAASTLASAEFVVGIGCNCSGPLEVALVASSLLRVRLSDVAEPPRQLALLLYPNTGELYANGVWSCRRRTAPVTVELPAMGDPTLLPLLKRELACGRGDVVTCAKFCCELLLRRERRDDWLFGVVVLGACCRSTPEDVAAVRAVVDAYADVAAGGRGGLLREV